VRLLNRLGAFLDGASKLLCDLGGALLLLTGVLINVEVFTRYGLGRSTLIADEYSEYLFVWMTLLAFSYALRTEQFLRVEVLVTRLPGRWRSGSQMIAAAAGLFVSLVLAFACLGLVGSNLRFGSVSIQPSQTPLWIPQLVLPAGLLWLALNYADLAIREAVRLRMRS
jgi:TRAP-type transport system small permease protein